MAALDSPPAPGEGSRGQRGASSPLGPAPLTIVALSDGSIERIVFAQPGVSGRGVLIDAGGIYHARFLYCSDRPRREAHNNVTRTRPARLLFSAVCEMAEKLELGEHVERSTCSTDIFFKVACLFGHIASEPSI